MKKYVEQSPITYASKIKTPTLIMSDTGDVRVPITPVVPDVLRAEGQQRASEVHRLPCQRPFAG